MLDLLKILFATKKIKYQLENRRKWSKSQKLRIFRGHLSSQSVRNTITPRGKRPLIAIYPLAMELWQKFARWVNIWTIPLLGRGSRYDNFVVWPLGPVLRNLKAKMTIIAQWHGHRLSGGKNSSNRWKQCANEPHCQKKNFRKIFFLNIFFAISTPRRFLPKILSSCGPFLPHFGSFSEKFFEKFFLAKLSKLYPISKKRGRFTSNHEISIEIFILHIFWKIAQNRYILNSIAIYRIQTRGLYLTTQPPILPTWSWSVR